LHPPWNGIRCGSPCIQVEGKRKPYFGACSKPEITMTTTHLIDRIAAYRRRRQAARELAGLSDHQLKDIGITRHDLFNPASH
jgi:uncharacterized protein YjiS (DUF1127 family)